MLCKQELSCVNQMEFFADFLRFLRNRDIVFKKAGNWCVCIYGSYNSKFNKRVLEKGNRSTTVRN